MTDIIDDLSWRGLIAVSTDLDDLRKALDAGIVTLYGGFDPTAPGLHIGNLVLLLTMRRFQQAGHRPIGLVGGATGLIGDPSGKSAERVLNPRELVAEWVERIRAEVSRFLDFTPGDNAATVVSNLDWTAELSAIDFLRDIGKHFPVNQMLSREVVRARLEAGGLSYTEFSYQILQANDYLELQPARVHAPARRQRPVGQSGLRRGSHPPGHRRHGARPGHAADYQAGRDQVRQDRGRGRLAEPRADEPVRVLPVLAEPVRCGDSGPAEGLLVPLPGRDRGAGARRRRSSAGTASRSGFWPRK